jgi:PKD repeat protein
MMKPIFFLCLVSCFHLQAQKHDNIWFFNTNVGATNAISYLLDFKRDSVRFDSIFTNFSFIRSASFFSDSTGNLLFQTSGCYIADAQGDTLINGDEIGLNTTQYTNFCPYGTYGVWQYGFFLNDPGDSQKTYFFYPAGNTFVEEWRYLIIEKTGLEYAVIEKNQVLIVDSILLGGFMANKHANGRDWWLVAMPELTNKMHKWLFDPSGLHYLGYQQMGVPLSKERHNEMVFSPDGSLLAQANPADDLRLWDFDRCTGNLSNPRHYPHSDTADMNNGIISGGMAISQDGRFLYRGNNFVAYQYDLHAPLVGASITEVAKRDPNSAMVLGGTMELGPDGRIYVKPANGTAYSMHVITHPERPTTNCGFEVNHYQFGGYAAMPMFPNYRLGPIDGSSCDTLGMNNYPLAGFRYDRLAGLLVDFTSISWYEPDTWQWNFGDPASGVANTSSEMHPDHVFSGPGLYTVCLTVSNQYGADTLCKQVYIDESVDVNEPQRTETEQGVLVYPNPANTWVEWAFPIEVSGELRLWSMVSTSSTAVSTSSNTATTGTIAVKGDRARMNVSALPAGVYLWSLQAQDGQVWSGKVVVVR